MENNSSSVTANSTPIAIVPIIRIDRNVVHNIDSLFDLFGIGGESMDDNLLRAIIYYLCLSYQQNLFCWTIFDPYDFAKTMGYSTSFLRTRHPAPQFLTDYKSNLRKQGKRETDIEEELEEYRASSLPLYESNLENALWALWQKEVFFCHGATFYNATEKEEVHTHEATRIIILRSLKIEERRSGKTGQR
jgi:hypothetical protein